MSYNVDCPVNKQNSNDSGLHVALEACLGKLPGDPTGPLPGVTPTWREMEPNEYSDFGQEVTTEARSPITRHRQNLKGSPTDIDANGGWNMDVTKTNTARMMQGFMFADARELPSSHPLKSEYAIPFYIDATSANKLTIDTRTIDPSVAESSYKIEPGTYIKVEGFSNPQNNGIFFVSQVDVEVDFIRATTVPAMVTDSVAAGQIVSYRTVGIRANWDGNATDAEVKLVNGQMAISLRTLRDYTVYLTDAPQGQWLFLGGDATDSRLGANTGYARIALDYNPEAETEYVRFDLTTFKPAPGQFPAADNFVFYIPSVVANARDGDKIVRRSYTLRRSLGYVPEGEQAEYLSGAVANEFTLNVGGQTLLKADLAYIATNYYTQSGDDANMAGTVVPARGEAAYNTSSNAYATKLYIHDKTTSQPGALFGYLQEGTINISNGVTPDKAVGVMGAFDVSTGNFTVGGELTAYFTTVKAAQAIRDNADVGLYSIFAADNAGFVADIPLLTLGGGRINVVKDQPITIPLTINGARAASLETMSMGYFDYLPNIAMPK